MKGTTIGQMHPTHSGHRIQYRRTPQSTGVSYRLLAGSNNREWRSEHLRVELNVNPNPNRLTTTPPMTAEIPCSTAEITSRL